MPVSKKRKKSVPSRFTNQRHKKTLYLPLQPEEANLLGLKARLSFEAVRQGKCDRSSAFDMTSVVLLCQVLTEDGHGLLPLATVKDTHASITALIETGKATGEWSFPAALIAQLGAIVNEYDRQMHETRLHAIVAASERVDRLLSRSSAQAPTDSPDIVRE